MASEIEDLGATAAPLRDRVGFKRAEMFSERLAGTVKAHDAHLFLCHGSAADWERATDEVPGPHAALAAALKATPELRSAVGVVKTTLFQAGEGDAPGDVVLFPQAR